MLHINKVTPLLANYMKIVLKRLDYFKENPESIKFAINNKEAAEVLLTLKHHDFEKDDSPQAKRTALKSSNKYRG